MTKDLGTVKRQFVDEGQPFGLYVWKMEDGMVLGDSDQNVLNLPGMRGDLTVMAKLKRYVLSLGIEGGEPLFLPGQRRISDMEHDEQMSRLISGYTPDPYDIAAQRDEEEGARTYGSRL